MVKAILIGCVVVVGAFLASTGWAEAPQTQPTAPLLVTSIRPLTLLAEDVAGDLVAVRQLLPPGLEPHHLALNFSQRRLLVDADMVLWVGPGLEGFLAKPLAQRDSSALISWQALAGGQSGDPHLWLDPGTTLIFARAVSARLSEKYPWMAAALAERLAEFEQRHSAAMGEISRRLSALSGGQFITEHDAYGRFYGYFGLTSAGSLTDQSGVARGARSLAQLREAKNVRCVVVEFLPAGRRAAGLAEQLGVPLVAIDPLGTTIPRERGYLGLIDSIARGFEQCLETGESLG